jgi:hypothetical protein
VELELETVVVVVIDVLVVDVLVVLSVVVVVDSVSRHSIKAPRL